MRIACPNKSGVLYKELLKLNNNDEDLTTYAHDVITELQDSGLMSLKRYKKPNGEFVYTIPKTITEKSLAENIKGKDTIYEIDKAKYNQLKDIVNKQNISFINPVISKSGDAIFVNITSVKNNKIDRLDFFLGDEALYEQELAEDRELTINRIQEEIKNKSGVQLSLFEQPLTTQPIKPGVQELFESNPELANSVYEALGYETIPVGWEKGKTLYDKAKPVKIDFKSGITTLPNGNYLVRAYRTDNTDLGSKGFGQRGEGLYLSLTNPYPGRNVNTVEFEIAPSDIITYKEEFSGTIPYEKLTEGKGNFQDRVALAGGKAFIGGINSSEDPNLEIVLYDKTLINKALQSKKKVSNFTTKYLLYDLITPQQKQQAQQLYSQYLDTIFPDSQLKDIVYHSGNINKEDKFDRNKIGAYSNFDLFYFSSIKTFKEIKTKLDLLKFELQKNLFYRDKHLLDKATTIEETIEIYKETDSVKNSPNKKSKISNIKFLLDNLDQLFLTRKDKIVGGWYDGTWNKGSLLAAILDIKRPYDGVKSKVSTENLNKIEGAGPLSNFILNFEYDSEYNPVNPKNIGVRNPEQIHILGSKQDIEGFKKFVEKTPTQTTDNFNQEDTQIINNLINEGEIKTKCN